MHNRLIFRIVFFLSVFDFHVLISQDNLDVSQEQFLFNGKEYVNIYRLSEGNPYLISENFSEWRIVFRGRVHDSVLLNYDVYNQKFLAEYVNSWGGRSRVILATSFIDTVYFNNDVFIRNTWNSNSDPILCVLSWSDGKGFFKSYSKSYKLSNTQGGSNYKFSSLIVRYYYFDGVDLIKIKNFRGLKKVLDTNSYEPVKKYINAHRISISRARKNDFESIQSVINKSVLTHED